MKHESFHPDKILDNNTTFLEKRCEINFENYKKEFYKKKFGDKKIENSCRRISTRYAVGTFLLYIRDFFLGLVL